MDIKEARKDYSIYNQALKRHDDDRIISIIEAMRDLEKKFPIFELIKTEHKSLNYEKAANRI